VCVCARALPLCPSSFVIVRQDVIRQDVIRQNVLGKMLLGKVLLGEPKRSLGNNANRHESTATLPTLK
jgi:hypothetical protein